MTYYSDTKKYNSLFVDDQTVEDAMQQQLLCYLQLLETNKPYILNITRTPGKTISVYRDKQC